jgi:hypothetical protein
MQAASQKMVCHMFSIHQRSTALAAFGTMTLVALAIFGTGCKGNSERVPISGRVTMDGKPIEAGSINFEPIDKKGQSTGAVIVNGEYQITGKNSPIPGTKVVRISAGRKTGRRIPAGEPSPPDAMVDEIKQYIPAIYNSQSTLTCEVPSQGSKQIDFDLKSR